MVSGVKLRFFSLVGCLALTSLVVLACGGDDDKSTPSASSSGNSGGCPTPTTQNLSASCDVTLESFTISSAVHVPEGTPMTYCSNPPSGGNHYPVWANFQEYTTEIPWPYLVHDLEHGAILLLYNCGASDGGAADGGAPDGDAADGDTANVDAGPIAPSAGCPDIVAQLRQVRDSAPADPLCDPGVKRVIIAPSSTILTKVAAAAWGHTYQASCADVPTLTKFTNDYYRKGPEDLCAAGRSF